MIHRSNSRLGNNKGFTLLEFVVVIALAAVIMVGVSILITKGKESAAFSDTNDKLQIIVAGLAERKVFNSAMPLQAAASTTWPAALEPYIPSDLRAAGAFPHSYQCVAATNQVTIGTPVLQDNPQATSVLQRLKDNNTCSAASTVGATFGINCVVKAFDGSANCQ